MTTANAVATIPQRASLVAKFAQRYTIDAEKLLPILKATAFKVSEGEVSNEQMAALLVVADQHGLNPFTREIYAFADKHKGIVPIVSVDGWARITNEHPQFNGVEFVYGGDGPDWIECHIFRKDRDHPIKVRELMSECKRSTGPWGTHPSRMLRHKAFIQCARMAFGFAGIFDPDEAEAIIEGEVVAPTPPQPARGAAGLKKAIVGSPEVSATASTEPSSQAEPKTKPAGSIGLRYTFVQKLGECNDEEILALVRDEAREFAWSPEDEKALDEAYSGRLAALQPKQ